MTAKHETVQKALAELLAHASGLSFLKDSVDICLELLLVLEEHPEITVQVADKAERRNELLEKLKKGNY